MKKVYLFLMVLAAIIHNNAQGRFVDRPSNTEPTSNIFKNMAFITTGYLGGCYVNILKYLHKQKRTAVTTNYRSLYKHAAQQVAKKHPISLALLASSASLAQLRNKGLTATK